MYETIVNNSPVQINVIKSRTGFFLKKDIETLKLLGGREKDVYQDKDGENVQKLQSVEYNNYQQAFKYFLLFYQMDNFVNLLSMLNTTITKFSFDEVWYTGQNSKQIEIENNVNITLIIG